MDPEQLSQQDQKESQVSNPDIPEKDARDINFTEDTYKELDNNTPNTREIAPGQENSENSENSNDYTNLSEEDKSPEYVSLPNIPHKTKSSLLKRCYTRDGNSTDIQASDFDKEETSVLTAAGIIENGELDPEKLENLKHNLLQEKGLSDGEGNINISQMQEFWKKQDFLQPFYESPEKAAKLNYLLGKDPSKDKTELLSGYKDLLQELGCYRNGKFDSKKFMEIKKQIETWKGDQEFDETVNTNLDEEQVLKIKQKQVINALAKFEQVKAGENLFNLIDKSLTDTKFPTYDEETANLFHENADFFKALFQNKVFFYRSFPKVLSDSIGELSQNTDIQTYFFQNPIYGKYLQSLSNLSPDKQKSELLAIITNPEKYAQNPEEAQIRKTFLSLCVSKVINKKVIKEYTELVYKQQICKEKVDTSKIFEEIRIPSKIIASATHKIKNFVGNLKNYAGEKAASLDLGKHEPGNFEKGAFTSSTITGKEIVDEYIEANAKFGREIIELSNPKFQGEIKATLITKLDSPKALMNRAEKQIKLDYALNISGTNEEKQVHFGAKDFLEESQISSFLKDSFIDHEKIKEKISKKLQEVGVPREDLANLTKDIFPQIQKQLQKFRKNEQKLQKSENREHLINTFETDINKQAVGYIVHQIKDALQSNPLTKSISLEKDKTNKAGEVEGLEIKDKKLYLRGSLDNSPCTICYDLQNGELKINSCCTQKDGAFYFNGDEPNIILTKLKSFDTLQHEALTTLNKSDNPQRQEQDIFNLKDHNTPQLETEALSTLERNTAKNEFYNVLLDNLGYSDKVISSTNGAGLHLYPFIENFEKVYNKEKIQEMTSFLQELKTLTNLPQGLNQEALQKTESQILRDCFSQEKIKEDTKFGENNSVCLLLSHFILPDGPSFSTFKTDDAQKWIKTLKNQAGQGEDQRHAIAETENQLFYTPQEQYRDYQNSLLSPYLNHKKQSTFIS